VLTPEAKSIVAGSLQLLFAIPRKSFVPSQLGNNPTRRAAIAGNLAQILRACVMLQHFEDMNDYAELLKRIKIVTSPDYGSCIKARDFSEIALAVCTLYRHQLREDLH